MTAIQAYHVLALRLERARLREPKRALPKRRQIAPTRHANARVSSDFYIDHHSDAHLDKPPTAICCNPSTRNFLAAAAILLAFFCVGGQPACYPTHLFTLLVLCSYHYYYAFSLLCVGMCNNLR